jgi:hypothetical protein
VLVAVVTNGAEQGVLALVEFQLGLRCLARFDQRQPMLNPVIKLQVARQAEGSLILLHSERREYLHRVVLRLRVPCDTAATVESHLRDPAPVNWLEYGSVAVCPSLRHEAVVSCCLDEDCGLTAV